MQNRIFRYSIRLASSLRPNTWHDNSTICIIRIICDLHMISKHRVQTEQVKGKTRVIPRSIREGADMASLYVAGRPRCMWHTLAAQGCSLRRIARSVQSRYNLAPHEASVEEEECANSEYYEGPKAMVSVGPAVSGGHKPSTLAPVRVTRPVDIRCETSLSERHPSDYFPRSLDSVLSLSPSRD